MFENTAFWPDSTKRKRPTDSEDLLYTALKRQKCFGTPDLIPKFMESQIREVPSDRMDWEHDSSSISTSNTSDLYLQIKVTPLCPSFNVDRNQGVGGMELGENAVSRQEKTHCPQCAAGQPGHISHMWR
ncbi:hypothetical protein CHS0354_016649 [Potamilus streckersoni]|uniref:Uncharacterized protein n=1 Tax=Potamilus streckersoni TaxID=2493646 RepID=A0AAE0THH7_9BIVA|nr:hypothetical protein CHS0354_016649 [Potamilus streckersoni]